MYHYLVTKAHHVIGSEVSISIAGTLVSLLTSIILNKDSKEKVNNVVFNSGEANFNNVYHCPFYFWYRKVKLEKFTPPVDQVSVYLLCFGLIKEI